MRLTAAALTLAAVLAGCQKGPGPGSASLHVRNDAGSQGPLALMTLQRIAIDCTFPAAPGQHAVRVDVTNPSGGLYATVPGQAETGPDGVARLSQWLEVSGTTIDHFHMVGTWRFALTVDEGPQLASASVDITD